MFFESSFAFFTGKNDEFPIPKYPVSVGSQTFQTHNNPIVHQGTPHLSGDLQTTGEAEFTDDIKLPPNTLHAALALATKTHAKILSIDDTKAKAAPGVHGVFYGKDLPNKLGTGMTFDDPIFAIDEIEYWGQPIAVVVADTYQQAKNAANLIEVKVEELPAIVTIQEAIKAESYHKMAILPHPDLYERGDVAKGFLESEVIVEGSHSLPALEHYYMEPHCTLVIPQERDEILIYNTAQSTTSVQSTVASVFGINHSKVLVKVKRLGGGFGGKGVLKFPVAATLASKKLGRPVKLQVERSVDLVTTGKRAEYEVKYKIGLKKDGKIVAADWQIFSNGGIANDLSTIILVETVEGIDNCYHFPNFRAYAKCCKTNTVSAQAFRGAGTPQAVAFCEFALDHVAHVLKMDPTKLREINLYKPGDEIPMHQKLPESSTALKTLWDSIARSSNYQERRKEVEKFNLENKYKKRGISIVPTKYPLFSGFFRSMLKSNCSVHLYPDGSALLVHGGIEMGQGLHTKLQQICAETLGIPLNKVNTQANDTYVNANAFGTGGSTGTDIHGPAIISACKTLLERLEPVKSKLPPDTPFDKLILHAGVFGVCLSATGFHQMPFDPTHLHDFFDFSWNAVVCEVELDVLTGKYKIVRCDLNQDVGKSLNPAVDIGQVEGAFLQGVGWMTLEECFWDSTGKPLFAVDNYEIPGIRDIPNQLNVVLLPNSKGNGVLSSKAIGEPPQQLGVGVVCALRQAVAAARKDLGIEDYFTIEIPATSEKLKKVCGNALAYLNSKTERGPKQEE